MKVSEANITSGNERGLGERYTLACRTGSLGIHAGRLDIWRETCLREAQNGRIACSFYKVRDFMDMHGLRSIHYKKRRQPESTWRAELVVRTKWKRVAGLIELNHER
jgi:hypothetical protein